MHNIDWLDDWWILNGKGCGRKQVRLTLGPCPNIHPKGLRKIWTRHLPNTGWKCYCLRSRTEFSDIETNTRPHLANCVLGNASEICHGAREKPTPWSVRNISFALLRDTTIIFRCHNPLPVAAANTLLPPNACVLAPDRICHLPSDFRRNLAELLSVRRFGHQSKLQNGRTIFLWNLIGERCAKFIVGTFKCYLKSRLSNGHYMKTDMHIEQVKYLLDRKICSAKI